MINSVGKSDGEYNNILKAASNNKVILKAQTANQERTVEGIFIPSSIDQNNRLHK